MDNLGGKWMKWMEKEQRIRRWSIGKRRRSGLEDAEDACFISRILDK